MGNEVSNGGFNILRYRIIGQSPLLLHNGNLADPLNRFSKMIKEISSKRNKTEADLLEMSKIEFHGGMYVNAGGLVILPAHVLSAVLVAGAKKSKLGTQFKSAVFVFDDARLEFDDKDKTTPELWDLGEKYVSRVPVVIGQARCMRTRPKFEKWSAEITVHFNPELVNEGHVDKALKDAGIQAGVGDWTPQHGRFRVEKI